jgi:hypothetical protein
MVQNGRIMMLLSEMTMQTKLEELYRAIDARHGHTRTTTGVRARAVSRHDVVAEAPRADATRILGQWLAARRAAVQ